MVGTPRTLTEERVAEINSRANRAGVASALTWIVVIVALATAVKLTLFVGIVVLVLGLVCTMPFRAANRAKRINTITYDSTDQRFAAFRVLLENLSGAGSIEHVRDERENWDAKLHGGAASLTTTSNARVQKFDPPFIKTNVPVWGIDVEGSKLFFFPDALLVFRANRYQAVPYESLNVGYATWRVLEYSPPGDAEVVEYTWEHANKDGGPDRRFSTNRRLSVALYGEVEVASSSVVGLRLRISDRTLAAEFVAAMGDVLHPEGGSRGSAAGDRRRHGGSRNDSGGRRSGGQGRPPRTPEHPKSKPAREILGVSPDASRDAIIAAYRKMALMYHPDKVAGLGPEFGELAERRMKEINAAYAELIQGQ